MVAAYSHWPVKLAGLNMQSPEWRQRHRRSRFFGASAEALDLRKTSASSVKTSVEVIACSPSTIIIRNVLTEQECARMIEITEAMKYEYIGVGREQQAWLTWILDEDAVCTPLFERVSQFLPGMIDAPWPRKLAGLNQRCRFYKYRPNDYDEFQAHRDDSNPGAAFIRNAQGETSSNFFDWDAYGDQESVLTFLLYLNDDFEGGETVLYPNPALTTSGDAPSEGTPTELQPFAVKPTQGSVLVFLQNARLGDTEKDLERALERAVLHEGTKVRNGRPKYVMRSDVLLKPGTQPPAGALASV
eukprot:CAMPEP_0172603486 /NCGR_PEP_ID=MMETSP1068-20121228/23741_1 /TAXON_ID=35684 /ORGANISM="Pseudopedinella elastica, Strain CCMP716" /LENGTH=300 /DNA_ID=CAMNT_0013405247 /DNA_START=60 /DNA_END=963 /DNA_ORIENTATION=-